MRAQPDLAFADEQEARLHLVYNGYREGRICDLDRCNRLDPTYYRQRYAELALDSDATAQLHYCYIGYYEDRFANADTEWLANVDLHIYQPGKVGSHAIAASLAGKYPGTVMHLHWPTDMALQYPACSLTYAYILAHPKSKPVRVISAGRELVSRVLSGMCQYLDTIAKDATGELDMPKAVAYLEDAFLHDCDVVAGWFDHQFHCGMDIYAHSFDHARGYARLRNETVDLFLYRQEDLACLEAPVGEFLGMPDFTLSRHNIAEEKDYEGVYRQLMQQFVVPRSVLEELYATPYMQFFFTEVERKRLIAYWSVPRRGW